MEAPAWDAMELRIIDGEPVGGAVESVWNEEGMRMLSPSGALLDVTWPRSVCLRTRLPVVQEVAVQPHLNTAIAAMSLRKGWQAFHAGAFERNGRSWGVLGANGSGKSSLLALAAAQGSGIIADDLLVIADLQAFAGPRCIDLRPDAARSLGVGRSLGQVGTRDIWRLDVGTTPLRTEMAGFIVPTWGPGSVEPVPRFERLRVLAARTAIQGPPLNNPENYLDLSLLPMFTWSRPRTWETSADALGDLLARLP